MHSKTNPSQPMEEGKLIRVFLGEMDKSHGRPLYEEILSVAQQEGMAGATILRGVESFGRTRHLHTAKVLRLAEKLPLVVEIVDRAEKVESFLVVLDDLLRQAGSGGLVTVEKIKMRYYGG